MLEGRIGKYWWYDREEEPLTETLLKLSDVLVGCRAVNTSFDSGLFSISNSIHQDWKKKGKFSISPIITPKLIESWPISHDEYCDEWYFFKNLPEIFDVAAYCNYGGCRIENWEELEFVNGANLLENIKAYSPEIILGNNEYTYIISRQSIQWVQA